MEYVTSTDGVRIAYQRSGSGPPLILVHGGATDHVRWRPLVGYLDRHFTVYAMDRRGRGESGDASGEYSMELEKADLAALANSIDGPVNVYGHSLGATLTLETASMLENPGRLILYEGVFPPGGNTFPTEVIDRLEALLDRGEHEELVTTFMRDIPRMPQHEIDHLRTLPQWPNRVATAPTIPRELRIANSYCFDPERFSDMRVPTLLLVGSDSPEIFKKSAKLVESALPNCQVRELPGQQHLADVMAPEMVASAIIEFLRE